MVLCGTWSETSVAQSQLTQFWQIPRHRTLSYSLWTPFFFTTTPSCGSWKYAKTPSTKKKLGEILYLLICSFLPCLSWLLWSRVWKSRRDLWKPCILQSVTVEVDNRSGNDTFFKITHCSVLTTSANKLFLSVHVTHSCLYYKMHQPVMLLLRMKCLTDMRFVRNGTG